eukprot:5588575-Amphidinium_carterae.1
MDCCSSELNTGCIMNAVRIISSGFAGEPKDYLNVCSKHTIGSGSVTDQGNSGGTTSVPIPETNYYLLLPIPKV